MIKWLVGCFFGLIMLSLLLLALLKDQVGLVCYLSFDVLKTVFKVGLLLRLFIFFFRIFLEHVEVELFSERFWLDS